MAAPKKILKKTPKKFDQKSESKQTKKDSVKGKDYKSMGFMKGK